MPTVLVVDDERLICTLLRRILEGEGFTVLTAESGSEALSVFRGNGGPIDLLISDVAIPDMEGPAIAAELLSLDPGMAVLFISGYCDEGQTDKCRGFEFLCKPFSLSVLLDKVRSLVAATHSFA